MWNRYAGIVGHIEVGEDILPIVPEWAARQNAGRVLVVADENTHVAAGRRVCALLSAAGVEYDAYIFAEPPTADEAAAARLRAACGPEHGLILGVGSGTINDLCKFTGFHAGRPCAIVGTAPSMDGYAAEGAAMTLGGMKLTPQTQCPSAIFCDISILKNAPMEMIAAGLGDMLGKISSLTDWRLSHLLTGEPMPGDVVNMMSEAVRRCAESADGAAKREPDAVRNITEGLILSGLAMSIYGDSRPASGAEHHLAHYWEMRALAENKASALHGLKVGTATLYALKIWKSLPKRPLPPKKEDRAAVLERVKREYGAAARDLLPVPNPNLSFDSIMEKWPDILKTADSAQSPDYVAALLKTVGAPLTAEDAGVNAKLLRDSVLLARERKKTYTVLQLLGDLGLLESFGEALAARNPACVSEETVK